MLVIRDDPQIDLLVKIACGRGQGGTIASEVRKNEFGHWEEKDVFSSTSCPAKVNLSVPDQITVDYPDDDRRLVALRLRDTTFAGVDAAFAGVEVSKSGGYAFIVLALNSTQRGSLPGTDHDVLYLYWDDSMTMALSGYMSGYEFLVHFRVSSDEITFRSARVPFGKIKKGGGEVIFERQKYRVAIRRGCGPIAGYLWMVGENRWVGIEFYQREGSQEKLPSFLWMLPECEIPYRHRFGQPALSCWQAGP
jgi:hypothetical protein